ncbi:hypothetical protein Ssi03_45890 [Sphaerisporangium siamense]|uniref:DUF6879 domain-containing protein n=1 Tax=Sphaerisporangium siamense TaxID=795645 RepID=A0A7W7D5H5_9ACTN|nr:DUF6879 family protein [Sphaerisporangium siamense]MBB4699276.1 hypothetical protein [Sphaerisporangium siamense]GII86599.1 hypothetical protein Ssi03_45890 [Sphaerisporangium siamense]
MSSRFVVRPEFTNLVLSFQHTAFRLETRDRYNEPSEAGAVGEFLRTGHVDHDMLAGWVTQIGARTAHGQRMERVRVVSEPHSDYTRFGLAVAAQNVQAGEDIRYLPRGQAAGLDLPDHDFWLIDSASLLILRFGDDDVLLGADYTTDPTTVVKHCYYRDVARHYAVPWNEYRGRVELPEGP